MSSVTRVVVSGDLVSLQASVIVQIWGCALTQTYLTYTDNGRKYLIVMKEILHYLFIKVKN